MTEKHIHFIGIGGVSMSGIATALLKSGYKVSGSDIKNSDRVDQLKKLGAKIFIGHSRENISKKNKPVKVVVSSAISKDNIELQKANKLGIEILKRAEMIAYLMQNKKGIAVSGTHGKTTTTGLVSTILKESGFDPTVMIGGDLPNIGGNVQLGDGDFFVTEADESDGSLLYLEPEISIVTNIELDHLDYYDNEKKLLNTFEKFIRKPFPFGKAIVWAEDEIISKIVDLDSINVITYGFSKGNIQAKNIKPLPFGSFYDLFYNEQKLGEINLQIPGRYNILNSLASVAVGMYAGLSFTEIKNALEKFYGVNRRFEKKGLIDDILIIDDYAHHPTEIKETLLAATNTGYNRVIAVFQPHRYTRTKHLFDEFCNSFQNVDHLIITDVYSADEKVNSESDKLLAKKMAKKCAKLYDFNVDYIEKVENIAPYLSRIIYSKDLVITVGAGDIYKAGEALVNIMKKRCEMA